MRIGDKHQAKARRQWHVSLLLLVHHPVEIAEQVWTVAVLSGGRFVDRQWAVETIQIIGEREIPEIKRVTALWPAPRL